MDTLRGFVRTMWEQDATIARGQGAGRTQVWSRLDARTGSLELRRITTRASHGGGHYPAGVRTDFYELYWADLTAGSTWNQVTGWVRYLLWRKRKDVPPAVRTVWYLLWAISLVLLMGAALTSLPDAIWPKIIPYVPRWLVLALIGVIGAQVSWLATHTFGRVVRYTRADPDNIAARAAVRERGLKLLDALHAGGDYDRIVIIGHSLGAILAYDLVSYYWARRDAARAILKTSGEFETLKTLESLAATLATTPRDNPPDPDTVAAYRVAQAELRRALAKRAVAATPAQGLSPDDGRWLISDLVTIGSPLTHSEFLLSATPADFVRRTEERELPIAPPYREALDVTTRRAAIRDGLLPNGDTEGRLFSFPGPAGSNTWLLHQAAPFAAVRWSNIHDPAHDIIKGDLISGPHTRLFGHAVEDVDLSLLRGPADRFSHTLYWSDSADPRQLAELRRVLNLLDA